MSLYYEFDDIEDADAFVREVKTRFGLDGETLDDADNPPWAAIDRVCAETDAEAEEIKLRFGLTLREIWRLGKLGAELSSAIHIAAEGKVDELAKEFGGEFVCT